MLTLILIVLALNTLFFSIESIVKKRKVTQWLLLISPQIIHAPVPELTLPMNFSMIFGLFPAAWIMVGLCIIFMGMYSFRGLAPANSENYLTFNSLNFHASLPGKSVRFSLL